MKPLFTAILSFFLLVQSLLPRTAMGLLQSEDVWAHYYEHKAEQKQALSFWDFLWMHYAADSEHTKQKKHHLPSFDFNSVAGFFVLPSISITWVEQIISYLFSTLNFDWRNAYSFLSSRVIICPPRA